MNDHNSINQRVNHKTKNVVGFLSGLIFGIGLLISGMTNPAKVMGFLDITGKWDISLALVMGGALLIAVVGVVIAKKRIAHNQLSISGQEITIPTSRTITPQLIIGSILFGMGWGLTGICPGPAVVMLGTLPFTGVWQGLVFVLAMLLGMYLFQLFDRQK